VSLKEIYEDLINLISYHNNSKTNGLSALPEYSCARATTKRAIGATRCSMVVQAGTVFTRSLLDAVRRVVEKGFGGVSIHSVASQSDEDTLELNGTLGRQSDAFAQNLESIVKVARVF
jgi:hypothetical protein